MKRRTILVILGYLAIAAPTPGAVGSCGRDDLAEPADFSSYCEEREQLICTRKYLRKEITAEARDICRWDAVDACERRAFPSDCHKSSSVPFVATREVSLACQDRALLG